MQAGLASFKLSVWQKVCLYCSLSSAGGTDRQTDRQTDKSTSSSRAIFLFSQMHTPFRVQISYLLSMHALHRN